MPSISKSRAIRKRLGSIRQPRPHAHDAAYRSLVRCSHCVWLKRQNAQQLTRHEPNCPTYAAHSRQADFRTNSNDIGGQRDWRPHHGGPPQRGTNYARGKRNHFYEGLVKRVFDKQSLQLPICRKIKVADGALVKAHGPVVLTMESMFGEHMIKC
uniref:Uncharacterized protein n=1 Tax=Romanomermis culicivorax TaxID=13658 RepID=A0A915JW34_ROMCU